MQFNDNFTKLHAARISFVSLAADGLSLLQPVVS